MIRSEDDAPRRNIDALDEATRAALLGDTLIETAATREVAVAYYQRATAWATIQLAAAASAQTTMQRDMIESARATAIGRQFRQ